MACKSVTKPPVVTDSIRAALKDSGVLVLIKFRSYDTKTNTPESSTRLAELMIGTVIFFSGTFNMSATVLRIANDNVALDAIDPLIPDKV